MVDWMSTIFPWLKGHNHCGLLPCSWKVFEPATPVEDVGHLDDDFLLKCLSVLLVMSSGPGALFPGSLRILDHVPRGRRRLSSSIHCVLDLIESLGTSLSIDLSTVDVRVPNWLFMAEAKISFLLFSS